MWLDESKQVGVDENDLYLQFGAISLLLKHLVEFIYDQVQVGPQQRVILVGEYVEGVGEQHHLATLIAVEAVFDDLGNVGTHITVPDQNDD